jgi:exocyst complex component 4
MASPPKPFHIKRKSIGEGANMAILPEVLEHIQSDWSFMAQDKCVPVQVALQLMDSSSLGRADQYGQFQATHKQLQKALKAIVNEHHQGFNSSIGTFHKIQSSIQTSQVRLRGLKDSLGQAKVGLSTTRPELKGLASTSQSYDEMLHALSQIEQLRLVTDKLEARISEKRFLTAVDVLQDALRMLRKPEMDNIGALSDLRSYLANQETSLTDILIEELHSHLYLKSPYCQNRWKAHAREQSNGASSEGSESTDPAVQPLYLFLEDFDLSKPMLEESGRNPEADTFYYIQLLVESLYKMGRLDVAVAAIEHRLPVELFRVVDKTNNEVDQRHPSSLRGNARGSKGKMDLGIEDGDVRAVVIYDLLWTLYAKFEAIAEGHRVFYEVVNGIVKREHIRDPDSLTSSFRELWMLYQNEIRSLLHDYLATDSNMYRMSQSLDPNADLFRRGQRKKDKKIFSLSDADPKSDVMSTEFSDLDAILKASVPGLVSDSRQPTGVVSDDKNQKTDGAATGHKLLIEPSVFNMGILLPPSLAFLQRLKDIVPLRPDIKTSTLTSFLDDFLVNVFLPQLDETLIKYSSQAFEEADAFQEDPQWSHLARRPIFKGASAFFNLITAFCRMLDTIPHDQAFSQLIITQMVSYYDKCCDWYQALVSRTQDSESYGPSLKASALIANGPGEIHDTIKKLWTSEEKDHDLLDKEIGLLILQTNETPLTLSDIIMDRKTIASLCLLYTSMRWLSSKINELRHITHQEVDSSRRNTMRVPQGRRWTLLNSPKPGEEKAEVYLPMTQETVV